MVADEGLAKYLRGVVWLRLVKIWAALRYDDHSWLHIGASPSWMAA